MSPISLMKAQNFREDAILWQQSLGEGLFWNHFVLLLLPFHLIDLGFHWHAIWFSVMIFLNILSENYNDILHFLAVLYLTVCKAWWVVGGTCRKRTLASNCSIFTFKVCHSHCTLLTMYILQRWSWSLSFPGLQKVRNK